MFQSFQRVALSVWVPCTFCLLWIGPRFIFNSPKLLHVLPLIAMKPEEFEKCMTEFPSENFYLFKYCEREMSAMEFK